MIGRIKPDLVIVQGDTTTAFIGALAAYYNQVKVAHIEAGLRSHSLYLPFRRSQSAVDSCDYSVSFCSHPTEFIENIAEETIFIVGNSGIDALMMGIKEWWIIRSIIKK